MTRRTLPPALVALLLMAAPAAGWQVELPTAEEFAEMAEEAAASPLFQSHELIRMTLTTDIEWLVDERNDSVEVDGTVVFTDLDGSEVEKPVEVRTRGNFRRDKRNCNFPPLRLDFPRRQMDGTVFEGQNRLKLVTPCHDGRGSYQNYIFDEYLAYRLHNIVTPYSFRVRLVEITYVDIEDDYDTRTKYAFLIEDEDMMAERNRSVLVDAMQFHPMRYDGWHSVQASMFGYMIGNLDWSPTYFHNVKLLLTEEGSYLPVPYDFDFSGTVNARYAGPPPQLADQARSVRDRVYRGFCRPELTYENAVSVYRDTRDEVTALYTDFGAFDWEEYDDGDAEDSLKYFRNFYKVVDDPEEFEKKIVRNCRDPQTG